MESKSDTLVEAAAAEIEAISRQVPNLLERKRVLEEMVARLRAIGGSTPVSDHTAVKPDVVVAARAAPKIEVTERMPTRKKQVREAIRDLLVDQGEVPRSVLLARLIDQGIMGHESRPAKRLGTLLNQFKDEFESDGKGNYRLRPPGSSEPGQGLSKERPA